MSPVCSGGSGVPVSGPLLRPVHSLTGFHQRLLPDIRIGALASVRLLQYLNDWLVVVELLPLLLCHLDRLL